MMKPIHLEHLTNRAIISLFFIPEEPISVGMINEGNIKKIVSYSSKGKHIPFIPAESIKGSMRSLAKKIFKNINNSINCNKGKHNDYNFEDVIAKIDSISGQLELFSEDQLEELSKKQKVELYIALFECSICKLFGSQMLTGKLIFDDMYPVDEVTEILRYTSNSIDRKSRIVKEDESGGRLFALESIKPNRLHLKIIADNIYKPESKLLASILDFISKRGLEVGGSKSRGYGHLRLDSSKIYLLEFKPCSREDVLNNIETLLQKDGYYKELDIKGYIEWLMSTM